MKQQSDQTIIISRTDAIGDVILTLPLCQILKEKFPGAKICFLGKSYTEEVIRTCTAVDEFINYDLLKKLSKPAQAEALRRYRSDAIVHVFPNKDLARVAKKAGIPLRIGTRNRLFHWFTCNSLVNLSRKNSDLHEAQLNIKLLRPFGIIRNFSLEEISARFQMNRIPILPEPFASLLSDEKKNIILHPKSSGSAREWGLENFRKLMDLLPEEHYRLFVSGTRADGDLMRNWLQELPAHVTDITGKMNLQEFISFIYHSDGLIAASTGPLHIAAATGNNALGLYPPMRPIFPQRWGPIGPRASYLVADKECMQCRQDASRCTCMNSILPSQAAEIILNWKKKTN